VASHMQQIGARVLLTGQFGDFITGNNPDDSDQVIGYLERGRIFPAVTEALAWSRHLKVPVYRLLWRAPETNLTPKSADPARESFQTRSPSAAADSLTPEFRRRVSSPLEIDRLAEERSRSAHPSQRRRFRSLIRTLEARQLQTPEPMQHLSVTHPFAHRPLVEF